MAEFIKYHTSTGVCIDAQQGEFILNIGESQIENTFGFTKPFEAQPWKIWKYDSSVPGIIVAPEEDIQSFTEEVEPELVQRTESDNVLTAGPKDLLGKAAIEQLIPDPVISFRNSANNESIPCYYDETSQKWLSIFEKDMKFQEARVNGNDWFQVGVANDSDSGYPVERCKIFIKSVEYQTEDGSLGGSFSTKCIDLWVDKVYRRTLFDYHLNGRTQNKLIGINESVDLGSFVQIRSDASSRDLGDTVVILHYCYDLT